MLSLTYDPSFTDGLQHHSPFTLITRSIEPAGRSFESFYSSIAPKKASKSKKPTSSKQPAPTTEQSEARIDPKKSKQAKSALSAFKLDRVLEGHDLYSLLDLPESASETQLKQSYRQLALKAHPDKQSFSSEAEAEEAKQTFLRIQAAFEVLSDPVKRRQYDCSRPFDESIPTAADLGGADLFGAAGVEGSQEGSDASTFYSVFGPVFDRNARWSNRVPVPSLGTKDSCYSEVEKFYEFWFAFDSWRDFPQEAEHDLSQASCREEKRWMERENQRLQKKLIQDERTRIMRLVETAQKLDPRVARFRAEEHRKKEDEKRAREAAKEAMEAARREAEEKEKRDKENEEKRKLQVEQERNNNLKIYKQKIKQKINSDELFTVVKNVNNLEDLEMLWKKLEIAKSSREVVEEVESFKNKYTSKVATAKKKIDVNTLDTSTWTPEELALFTKALNKYPVGVPKRWEQVANLIGTRSVEETVAMSKRFAQDKALHLAAAMSKPKTNQAALETDDWTETQQKALEQGLKRFPPNTEGDRWAMIAEQVGGKTKQQCVARFRYLKELMAARK